MLDSLKKRPGSLRWPPRQKFSVTDQGREAVEAYQRALQDYHAARAGRDELERVQQSWAEQFQVAALDASILEEFAGKERQPREVQRALEDCGITLAQVQETVDRLFTAGLLAPLGRDGPLPAHGSAEDAG